SGARSPDRGSWFCTGSSRDECAAKGRPWRRAGRSRPDRPASPSQGSRALRVATFSRPSCSARCGLYGRSPTVLRSHGRPRLRPYNLLIILGKAAVSVASGRVRPEADKGRPHERESGHRFLQTEVRKSRRLQTFAGTDAPPRLCGVDRNRPRRPLCLRGFVRVLVSASRGQLIRWYPPSGGRRYGDPGCRFLQTEAGAEKRDVGNIDYLFWRSGQGWPLALRSPPPRFSGSRKSRRLQMFAGTDNPARRHQLPSYQVNQLPDSRSHHHLRLRPWMILADDRIFAGLVEQMSRGLERDEAGRSPRAVLGGDGVQDPSVVHPSDRRPRLDADAVRIERVLVDVHAYAAVGAVAHVARDFDSERVGDRT